MNGVRILVAEDEGIVAEDLRTKLTRMGSTVVGTVASGEEALAVAERTHPDVVLMDIRLAGTTDGIEAARRIREQHDAAVIYVTAYSDEQTIQRAKETEPFGYLIKPIRPRELQVTIEMAMHKREMERRLQASERRWATTLVSIGDAVLATDRDGRITFLNPVAERLTRWTQGEALGLPVEQVFHIIDGSTRAVVENPVRQALRECRVVELPHGTLIIAKDGSEIPIVDRGSRIQDDEDRTTGCVLVFRDDSGRQRAEEERRQLEARFQHTQKLESLGVLAGGIAHDFNNILTVVLGYAELALQDVPPASAARGYLQQVIEGSRRAAELTHQMLVYSGKGQFVIQPVHLSELVRDMDEMLKSSVSKKAVVVYRLADELPLVEADATQMRQIVLNLIINASDALGGQTGTISVTTGTRKCDRAFLRRCQSPDDLAEGLYAFVEVADSGGGMSPETLARIFEPFFTTKFTGRGLGLAVVLGIVRGHRGALRVVSEPGHGSTFTLLLPAASQGLSVSAPPAPAARRGSGSILVVDDEASVRGLARRMLEQLGFTVLTACDGREAVDVYRAHADDIDAVLLDLTMPQLGGIEAYDELRRIKSDVRVILSTGYGEQELSEPLQRQGLAAFMAKPYGLKELTQAVGQALGR